MMTSERRARAATSGTPTRSASSARFEVAWLRPAAAQTTAPARGRSAEPTAAPMAPGCSTPTTGRGGIAVTGRIVHHAGRHRRWSGRAEQPLHLVAHRE